MEFKPEYKTFNLDKIAFPDTVVTGILSIFQHLVKKRLSGTTWEPLWEVSVVVELRIK